MSIETAGHGFDQTFKFTVEGSTARLVDIRTKQDIERGWSAADLMDLNTTHDAVLRLPFIDRCTVWMKGRTDTEVEDGVCPDNSANAGEYDG